MSSCLRGSFLTWQRIRKSHRITTKVAAADNCSLAVFKAALVFIPIIVMPVVALHNLISLAADAAVVVTAHLR